MPLERNESCHLGRFGRCECLWTLFEHHGVRVPFQWLARSSAGGRSEELPRRGWAQPTASYPTPVCTFVSEKCLLDGPHYTGLQAARRASCAGPSRTRPSWRRPNPHEGDDSHRQPPCHLRSALVACLDELRCATAILVVKSTAARVTPALSQVLRVGRKAFSVITAASAR
jgi:hypothetical protein